MESSWTPGHHCFDETELYLGISVELRKGFQQGAYNLMYVL
jgi:hypothetical protein